MKVFLDLGYSLDLILHTQIASSWLWHRPLFYENFFGASHLNYHTYLLLLPLGLLAFPFGAPGLLCVLSLSVGFSFFMAVKILRCLAVGTIESLCLAAVMILSPLSLHTFHDWQYGFHVELLEPSLALLLFYALLQNRVRSAVIATLLLLSVKEDTPFLVCLIGLAAPRNRSALIAVIVAAVAFPILLWVISSGNAISRLPVAHGAGVRSYSALIDFILAHLASWPLSSQAVSGMLALVAASLGGAMRRPWLIVAVLPLTLVSWLQNDDPLWAPRFASILAFGWCVGFSGLAMMPRKWRIAFVIPALCISALLAQDWKDAFAERPWSHYTEAEVRQADETFLTYREMSTRAEPVIAHIYLFRYAHDRNLFWFHHIDREVKPVWILWDLDHPHFSTWGFDPGDYDLIKKNGRFALYRVRSTEE